MHPNLSVARALLASLLLFPTLVEAVPDAARQHAEQEAEAARRAADNARREAEALRRRIEQERIELQRLEQQRLERERLEHENRERSRIERENLEAQRIEQQRIERDRHERERLEAQHFEQERLEKLRREREHLERQRAAEEAASPYSRDGVNGYNVQIVQFGQQGQQQGSFVQTGPGQWQEQPAHAGGNAFAFEERQRDDWSVYLFDASRGVAIQLDLHTRIVYYSDAQSPRRELYQVLSAFRPRDPQPATVARVEPPGFGTGFDPNLHYRLSTAFRGPGMSLDIHNGGDRNDMAHLAQSGSYSGQHWRIVPRNAEWFELRTAFRGDHVCLDVYNGGERNLMPHMANCADVSGQFWKLVATGDGYYRIQNMFGGNGRCLDIFNGGSYDNGPHLTDCAAFSGQAWRVEPTR